MTILALTDTVEDVVVKLSQGNPGALRVLVELLKEEEDREYPPVLDLLKLDDMGIYGPMVWLLYKDTFKLKITPLRLALQRNRLDRVVARKMQLSPGFAREWTFYKAKYRAGNFEFN